MNLEKVEALAQQDLLEKEVSLVLPDLRDPLDLLDKEEKLALLDLLVLGVNQEPLELAEKLVHEEKSDLPDLMEDLDQEEKLDLLDLQASLAQLDLLAQGVKLVLVVKLDRLDLLENLDNQVCLCQKYNRFAIYCIYALSINLTVYAFCQIVPCALLPFLYRS